VDGSPVAMMEKTKEGSMEDFQEGEDLTMPRRHLLVEERTRRLIQGPKMYHESLKHLDHYLVLSKKLMENMVIWTCRYECIRST
jgi:hypothetical protein